MKFSKMLVVTMILTAFAFVAVVVASNLNDKQVQPELIISFFAFIGVEGGAMAWIKNMDTKHGGAGKERAAAKRQPKETAPGARGRAGE